MKNTYKIRIHSARMETRYGVDFATIVDNPIAPEYTEYEIISKLMEKLSYEEATDDNPDYTGYYDGDIGAYFDYDGYIDVEIPESIVNDIVKNAKKGC